MMGGGRLPPGKVELQHPVGVGGTRLGSVCRVWKADRASGLAIGALHEVVPTISRKNASRIVRILVVRVGSKSPATGTPWEGLQE